MERNRQKILQQMERRYKMEKLKDGKKEKKKNRKYKRSGKKIFKEGNGGEKRWIKIKQKGKREDDGKKNERK